MTDNYHKVLDSIKKNYKNTEFLLDIYLSDYHDNYIYIRLDYYKKSKSYKLSWLDLKAYNNNFESIEFDFNSFIFVDLSILLFILILLSLFFCEINLLFFLIF